MSLPEGALKNTIEEKFAKLMKVDDLSLLKLIGPYVIGRVKYGVQEVNDDEISFDDILNNDTAILFEKLIEKFAIRSGVSGVQPKVLLDIYDKNTLLTQHYIVKSWGKEYPELAFNEYFCMRAITYTGLPTPEFFLSKNREMFIIKRFDIKEDNTFLGFEDGCVLLGKGTKDKYEASYEELAKAIKSAVRVQEHLPSLKKLFTAMIMNHFLGNGDGHLKNYGILYENDYDDAFMAPIYDVVCTTVYIPEDIPALRLSDGKLWWKKKTYVNFAKNTCRLKTSEIDTIISECKGAVVKAIGDLEQYVQDVPKLEEFSTRLKTQWEIRMSTFL